MATACEENLVAHDLHTGSSVARVTWIPSIRRNLTSFPTLLIALLVTKVFWTCRGRIGDPDIYWHLLNGKYIISTYSFPRVDTHCFTTMGMPWTDHAWLSEIIFYGGFRAFGLIGVYFVFATCLAVTTVLVYRMCVSEGGDPLAAAGATAVGAVLAMVGWGPRTHIFGWLCFTVVFAILLQFQTKRQAPLWALPLIFVVWVNLHASWMFGLVVLGIFVIAGLIRRDIGFLTRAPWEGAELKKLILAGALSVGALFVNPFGYRTLLVPINMLHAIPLSIRFVDEYASVDFNDLRGKVVAAVLCAVFVLAFTSRKPWRIVDALLVMFVLYCGLAHIRFLFVAGIVLPPILAPKLGPISSYDGVHERRALNGVLLAITLVALVFGVPSRKMLDSDTGKYFPVRAVEYLRTNPPTGHLFHQDNWGGYLEWQLPQVPTFMDTRADIFEERGVVKAYIDITSLRTKPEQLLDTYQISDVLFATDSALVRYLSNLPQWERVYADKQSVIYRRVRNDSKVGNDMSNKPNLQNSGQLEVVTNLHVEGRSSLDSENPRH